MSTRTVLGWSRRKVGMTAVELAAVVTIVAIMAVVLIPVLGTARSEATKQQTARELTPLYNALHSHATDPRRRQQPAVLPRPAPHQLSPWPWRYRR